VWASCRRRRREEEEEEEEEGRRRECRTKNKNPTQRCGEKHDMEFDSLYYI